MNKVKNKRINNPSHIKNIIAEQINILRQDESLDKIEKARAIAYLSNVALSAYKDGEAMNQIDEIKKRLEGLYI